MRALAWLGLLVLLAGLAGGGWLFARYRAFLDAEVTPPGGKVAFTVAPGTSLRALARDLDDAGIIADPRLPGLGSAFYLWAHRVEGAGAQIKAGEYLFDGPATPAKVLAVLREGRVRTYQVTIPEGLRLDEVASLFEDAGLGSAKALLVAARDPDLAADLGVPADSLEGYVFPDTYTFARGLSPRQMLAATVERFDAAWTEAEGRRARGVTLSKHEAVTLASIIEKETGQAHERPRIGCVFHNRLQDGMRLQTDPTVIYAKILMNGGVWDGNITKADLQAKHPYNTYVVKGLPPGPIASPGLEALVAALNPADCDDLFFVSRNDGTHVFCPDYACHLRAVNRYQRP